MYYIGKKLVTIARFILGETFIVSKFSWPFFRKVNDSESTESTVDSTNDEDLFRPTIGVALGSGSARGWAHIGIMRALEEGGIEPDFICGTSIGAVVGGCYLNGRLTELEKFARSLTKRRVFSLMDFSFGSSGLISGNKLGKLLQQNLGNIRIEMMKNPFICVATELGTGHEIWLRSGPLVDAMRASYCLPGVFAPIKIGGRWLVDGALVNPIPVSVCRALGSRIVIAVNLSSDAFGQSSEIVHSLPAGPSNSLPEMDEYVLETKEDSSIVKALKWKIFGRADDDLPGVTGVMTDAFNIIQDRMSRSRLAADPPDILLTPELTHISLLDFHRAEECIAVGYETGRQAIKEIKKYMELLK